MKTMTKVILSGAALAGAAVASHAQVPVPAPSTDSSELIFFVSDTSNGTTYAFALSQLVGNTTGSYFNSTDAQNTSAVSGTTIGTITGDAGFTYSFSGDTAFQSFLSSAGTANLAWGLIGGAYPGNVLPDNTRGDVLMVTTGSTTSSILNVADSNIYGPVPTGYASDVSSFNAQTFDSSHGTSTAPFCTSGSSGDANCDLYGSGVATTTAEGTSEGLYGLTANGKTTAKGEAYAYLLGNATFNGTSLVFTGEGTTVPIPAAAWLLGSGLLGLLGIARRRERDAVQTA